jgi:hypothetical protein
LSYEPVSITNGLKVSLNPNITEQLKLNISPQYIDVASILGDSDTYKLSSSSNPELWKNVTVKLNENQYDWKPYTIKDTPIILNDKKIKSENDDKSK